MQHNEKKDLNDFKTENATRERSVFVFMKLRVSDIELEAGDYEIFQLKYKRLIQKTIEEHAPMRTKLIIVTT